MDKEFIIKPYLVDENLNKKKKQPKFAVESKLKQSMDLNTDVARNWNFMETCRMGTSGLKEKQNNQTVYCRYLHHQNPYLKLGPFKVQSE